MEDSIEQSDSNFSPRLAAPLLAWRAGLLFLMLASLILLPDMFDTNNWRENPHWPAAAEAPTFETHWKTWDSQHYLRIAETGYDRGTKTSAFYPLWPLMLRATAPLFGGSFHVTAIVLANLLAVLACLLLHGVIARKLGGGVALRSVFLLLAFPGAFFLGLPYSESLFLTLIALFFWALDRDRLPVAACAAMLLPMCRPTGILILIPLAVHFGLRLRRERIWRPTYLWTAAPVVGFCGYLGLMTLMAGDPFEGFAAQSRFFIASSVGRLFDLGGFISFFISGAISLHGVTTSLIDRLWFLWLLACLPAVWKLDKTWFAFTLVMGVIPAMTIPIASFTRYALVLFPMFAVTANFLDTPSRRPWTAPLLVGLGGIQAIFMIRHINNLWAG